MGNFLNKSSYFENFIFGNILYLGQKWPRDRTASLVLLALQAYSLPTEPCGKTCHLGILPQFMCPLTLFPPYKGTGEHAHSFCLRDLWQHQIFHWCLSFFSHPCGVCHKDFRHINMVDQPETSRETHERKRNHQVYKNVSAISTSKH